MLDPAWQPSLLRLTHMFRVAFPDGPPGSGRFALLGSPDPGGGPGRDVAMADAFAARLRSAETVAVPGD